MRSKQEIRERLKQCEVDYKLEKGFVNAAVIAGELCALKWVLGDE